MHAVNNLSTCTDRGAGWSRDTHGTTPTYERSNAQARPRDEPGADRTRGTDRILRPTQINNLTFLLFFPSWRLGRGHRPRACCPRAWGSGKETFCKRSPAAPSFGATWSSPSFLIVNGGSHAGAGPTPLWGKRRGVHLFADPQKDPGGAGKKTPGGPGHTSVPVVSKYSRRTVSILRVPYRS